MASTTDRLYLISVKDHAVAIVPDNDARYAIGTYLERVGFNSGCYMYFRSHLMINSITVDLESANLEWYCIITGTNTISGDGLSISARHILGSGDLFSLIDLRDINNSLFVKPTIKEVRDCAGFDDAPECELRKFCI